ncbi:ADP-ribose pyrophosphatase YjhB, NUDIX family [Catalinimonas alkaloidigena]|uniref:ADP-ribose pyrophosphatase YjhB, NUDIX family n=1 Tax=Catalinimonas alkaloidigena TaxID=1075417 RepID=A0A1G9AEE5_9BACT|nr:NUDIX domain-containing protein [Catalinimonas alkaloidigena]SDK24890.1 ADP-ribose pyrophosphatase YjhB, NUDIX family [Catalinimonas alkaloidigena]
MSLTRPAIAVFLTNARGEVLLQKRKLEQQWGLISGKFEFGETVEQAAVREVWEETGRWCRIEQLIGVYSDPLTQVYAYPDQAAVHYVTIYLKASFTEEGPIVLNDESLEFRFFPPDALPDNLLRMSEFWLADALHSEAAHLR